MVTANKVESMLALVVLSSVTAFFLTSITFFFIGYVCGCRQRCRKSADGQISSKNVDPVYENNVPGPAVLTTEQVAMDLTINEAYGSFNIGISQS